MARHPKPRTKTPEELEAMAATLTTSYLESIDILDPRSKSKPMSNYASQIGHPCAFYLWAKRAHWEEMPTPDLALKNVFALGREHEQAMKVRLQLDGWLVTKVENAFVDEEHNVHGYMDWELRHPFKPGWDYPVTTEFKTTASRLFDTLTTFEDLFSADKKWLVMAPYQVLKYAAMDPELRPQVALVYRCKGTGRLKVLLANTADHVHKLEAVHARLDVVNHALQTNEAPPAIPYQRMWCDRCDAAALCPTMQAWSGANIAKVIPEPGFIDAITDVWLECDESRKLATNAWDDLKDQLEHYGAWKELEPGDSRELVGGRYRYPVKVVKGGGKRLDAPVPITGEEEPVGYE
jgi:hypothetical protein